MTLLRLLRGPRAPDAEAVVRALPAYQVALWPDGWELAADGAVLVRDTHDMAEARRWYRLAERNRRGRGAAAGPGRTLDRAMDRAMHLHGTFVPRAVVELAGRRFASAQVASVALRLVASDWIDARRRRLLAAPARALAERARAWSGSRHDGPPEAARVGPLVRALVAQCIAEGLVPPAEYRISLREDDGFGLRGCRCAVHTALDRGLRQRAEEVLNTALIPWNRAVIRAGEPTPLIAVRVEAR